jgi:hypothetical protein
MSKVIIKGNREPVIVSREVAEEVKNMWMDRLVPETKKIVVGTATVTKGDIKSVFLEEDVREIRLEEGKDLKEFFGIRNKMKLLSPKEKAEFSMTGPDGKVRQTTWEIFKILYWSVKGELPSEEMKTEVFKSAEEFYSKNTDWTFPRIKCFSKFFTTSDRIFGDKQGSSDFCDYIHNHAIKIIERAEIREGEVVKSEKGDVSYNS